MSRIQISLYLLDADDQNYSTVITNFFVQSMKIDSFIIHNDPNYGTVLVSLVFVLTGLKITHVLFLLSLSKGKQFLSSVPERLNYSQQSKTVQ